MSPLTWSLEDIENHKEVCWVETGEKGEDGKPLYRMNTVTETLIFMTMAVHMGSITETNADEFYARLKLIEQLDGPFMWKTEDGKKVDVYFTPEDVQAHIGLACNVITESFSKFLGVVREDHKQRRKEYHRAMKKAQEAVTS